ncbi:MAG: 50S ribosomal protein L5 [Promethearchaeota archaeon]
MSSKIISNVQRQEIYDLWNQNPNIKPRLEIVVINIAVGTSGEVLQKAAKVLEDMTGQTPKFIGAKKSIKDFGIRKGENIAVKVTLRNSKARDIIERLMIERDYKILKKSFDDHGNVSFGVSEHINVPGMKYDPNIGIFGFDVSIRLVRPGYRVRTRKIKRARIPRKQYVSKEETMLFMEEEFKAEIVEKIEIFWY